MLDFNGKLELNIKPGNKNRKTEDETHSSWWKSPLKTFLYVIAIGGAGIVLSIVWYYAEMIFPGLELVEIFFKMRC